MKTFLFFSLFALLFSQYSLVYHFPETCDRGIEENVEVYPNHVCQPTLSRHFYQKYDCNFSHTTYSMFKDASCSQILRTDTYVNNDCHVFLLLLKKIGSKYLCGPEPSVGQFGYVQTFYSSNSACLRNGIPLFKMLYHGGCVVNGQESTGRFINNNAIVHEQYTNTNCLGTPFRVQRFELNQCKEHLPPFTFKYHKQ